MKTIKQELRLIYHQLDKLLLLFGIVFTFIEWFWLPINGFLAEKLLAQTGNLYLSYNNIWQVLTKPWWVGAALVGLLFLNLVISYGHMLLIFVGIRALLSEEGLRAYCQRVFSDWWALVQEIRPSKVVFCLFYLLVLFPFWGRLLHLYFFNKLLIPQFILDYWRSNYYLAILLLLAGLMFAYLGIRLMFALPLVLFDNQSVRRAVTLSWAKTSQVWGIGWRLLGMYVTALFTFFLLILGTVLVQLLADRGPEQFSFLVAVAHYVLIKLAWYALVGLLLVRFVTFVQEGEKISYRNNSLNHGFRFLILGTALVLFSAQAMSYYLHPYEDMPKTISHRGVTDANGVQNTLAALEKTARLRPDYVEIDVQETKDGQFVLMHDRNLKALAGVDGETHDFTLAELQGMQVSENGYRSPVSSLDDYLVRAGQLNQKLLIEIKSNSRDSPEMIRHFLQKYGQDIRQRKHLIQSLDYRVVEQVKAIDRKLAVYFILPYTSIFPRTQADGYVMEYSSLTLDFMNKLRSQEKQALAWTANDEETVERLVTMEVDGIITDRLAETQRVLRDSSQRKNYLALMLRFVAELTAAI
ncbi:glycerophosphodiester phosphodiesterase [Streptococcus cuniculipharyngis]|uniref:Glycerophosphodiester phosphodiesterase n=1 Tax=Streptococcus cuniculipharyngis TaxID=1562651 RepID=A0A5C5S9T7_9STRE|nr:glycerophosphodiester phosphodiesterase [Streptococcus cuniculipharyngis]TWS96270.1 glycerophosphodiester phosphodiesterase [Streptococcus cuniculipharyngis]